MTAVRIAVAVAEDAPAPDAARAIAARVSPGGAPAFLAVHGSARHDAAALAAAFAAAFPGTAIHGGSSCRGVMSGAGFHPSARRAVGAFAIHDPDGAYGTGAAPLAQDPRAAGRLAVERALAAAGRVGEAPDIVWLTAAPGSEEAVLSGIADVVGPSVPVFGGSSADDDVAGGWFQFSREGAGSSLVVASVLFPSAPIGFGYHSGYEPTERAGTVTAAEGRVLRAIDGEAAALVYDRWSGGVVGPPGAVPRVVLSESTFHPLGRPLGTVAGIPYHLLAHPAVVRPDGALELFADVAPGERLVMMTGDPDSLVGRAGRVARGALASGRLGVEDVAGALVVYCGGCMMAVEERMDEVVAGVDAALGGAPFLGIFTFGEQGCLWNEPSRHGNLMIACAAFGR